MFCVVFIVIGSVAGPIVLGGTVLVPYVIIRSIVIIRFFFGQ